jgi:DNA adenine methylase
MSTAQPAAGTPHPALADSPTRLHDYRYLGRNFRERLRINRKIKRMARRLARLPVLERNAIIASLSPS